MNKAILIVICDFLVSSMLTMMTGMIPGEYANTGSGEKNDLAIRQEAIFGDSGMVYMPEEEEEADNSAELLKRLREEAQMRLDLEKQLNELNNQLGDAREKIRGQEKKSAVLENELIQARTSLGDVNKKLDAAQVRLHEETGKHQDTVARLAVAEERRKKAEADVAENQKALIENQKALQENQKALQENQKNLLEETRKHGETAAKLAVSESKLKDAEESIRQSDKKLASAEHELAEVRNARIRDRENFVRLDENLRNTSKDLQGTKKRLQDAENQNKEFSRNVDKWRIAAHENKKELGARERDLAELQDKLARKEKEFLIERLKRQDAETQRDMMQDSLKDAVKQLSDKDDELNRSRQELSKKEGELKASQNNGSFVAVPSENRVFERYAGAIVRIECSVTETAHSMMTLSWGERTGKTTSFFPVVDFGDGKVMIVGALNRFAGDWDVALKFADVTSVKMSFAPPFGEGSNSPKLISDRMLVSTSNLHLAGFSYTDSHARPLRVIDAAQLQRFGVEDLYLFKSDRIDSNTRLTGRVSMIPDNNVPAIFIRNVGRNGLNADQGDFVLTSRGEFVGIVSEKVKLNNVDGYKVLLIKDSKKFWEQVMAVPLSKNPEETYFSGYAAGILELRKNKHIRGGYERGK